VDERKRYLAALLTDGQAPQGLLNTDQRQNALARLLAREPGVEYGSILPFAHNPQTGETSLALPGMLRDPLAAGYGLLSRALAGDFVGAEQAPQAFDLASGLLAGGTAFSRPVNSLGILGGRAGPHIPESAPKNLRERYSSALYAASDGKDPNRIKLTDERMERAAEHLRGLFDTRTEVQSAPPTVQLSNARAFASEAVKLGEDVRLKLPEGPRGSVYVRVGRRGTVRFADHPQPKDGKEVVGGFSKALGRRHYPATMSVDPAGEEYANALAWLLLR
jgi:hypothetical protein